MKKKYIVLLGTLCVAGVLNCADESGVATDSKTELVGDNIRGNAETESTCSADEVNGTGFQKNIPVAKTALALCGEELGDMADYLADDIEQSKINPVVNKVTYREIFERMGAYVLDVFLDTQAYIKNKYTLCKHYMHGLTQENR